MLMTPIPTALARGSGQVKVGRPSLQHMDPKVFRVFKVYKVAVSIRFKVYKDLLVRKAHKVFKVVRGLKD